VPKTLSRETLSFFIDRAPASERRHQALALLESIEGAFSVGAVDLLADTLEASCPAADPGTLHEVGESTPARNYVQARLLAAWGMREEALGRLDAAQAGLPRPEAALHLTRARWCQASGRAEEAVRALRSALQLHPPYSSLVRVERLIQKLASSKEWTPRRRVRIALLSSSTTAFLAPVLQASLLRDGILAEFYEGAFGAYRQEILDPASALYSFKPDIGVLLIQGRDLPIGPTHGWQQAAEFLSELRGLWCTLQERLPCHLIQARLGGSRGGAWGALEDCLPEGRRRVVERFNLELSEDLPRGVTVLNFEALSGAGDLLSEEEWSNAKQYPRSDTLPIAADLIAAQVRAVLGLSAKVLVTDLDNTLWSGIIGEDGLQGIRIGPPSAEGEGHRDLQRYMAELKARGVLLAVCSKNNPKDAEAPFQKHDGMLLKLTDFSGFRANWEDKVSNLQSLATELSLGFDSFVFLDDSAFERNLVRRGLPEVTVPEVEANPWSMLRALQRGLYFEAVALTQEDLQRNASYAVQGALRSAREGATGTLDEFLTGLGMVSEHGPVDGLTIERVTQLVNKTNQFNLTTRRHNLAQVRQMAESADWWTHWFKLSDRFGDHGLVGVMIAKVDSSCLWTLDTWLMSCRVLGRRMEDFMVGCLISAAAERGVRAVRAQYIETAKNKMVADLLPRLGFCVAGDGWLTLDPSNGARSQPWVVDQAARPGKG
jgi:FkbH-like protein